MITVVARFLDNCVLWWGHFGDAMEAIIVDNFTICGTSGSNCQFLLIMASTINCNLFYLEWHHLYWHISIRSQQLSFAINDKIPNMKFGLKRHSLFNYSSFQAWNFSFCAHHIAELKALDSQASEHKFQQRAMHLKRTNWHKVWYCTQCESRIHKNDAVP